MSQKRKSELISTSNSEENNNDNNNSKNEANIIADHKEVTVILDLASLEIVKTKKGDFQLLNCDDHIRIMKVL